MPTTYNQYPIYISQTGTNSINLQNYFMPFDLSVDYEAQVEPKRYLPVSNSVANNIVSTAALNSKISFSFYLNSSNTGAFGYLANYFNINNSNSKNYTGRHNIQIGNSIFSGCYLDELTISCDNMFKPMTSSVSFTCTNPPQGSLAFKNDFAPINDQQTESSSFIYGYASAINNFTTSSQSKSFDLIHKYSFKQTLSISRTPVYTLGSINAQYMLMDGVEKNLNMSCDDVNGLMNFSGNILNNNLSLKIKDVYSNDLFDIVMNAGSRIISQNISVQEKDTLGVSISIKEVSV